MKRNSNIEMIRRVAISLCVFVVSFSAFAQERGDVAFGVNGLGGIYTDKILSYGIGLKLLYNVADPVRLAAEMDFSAGTSYDDLIDSKLVSFGFQDYSLYAHYLIPISRKFLVYPLIGGGMLRKSTKTEIFDNSEKKIVYKMVGSFGAGFEYAITNNLSSSVELRFKHDGRNHYIYLASIAYKF